MKLIMKGVLTATLVAATNTSSLAETAALTIRVAILDNLKSEKLATERYIQDYLDGIELARRHATKRGVNLEVKPFFYNKRPLSILEQVPALKTWGADVVIGPRSSSQLLALREQLADRLVVSPMASATEIATLPKNFHSVAPSNDRVVQALVQYVSSRFKGRSVFAIAEADCVYCVDLAKQFTAGFHRTGMTVRNEAPALFVSSGVETVAIDKLLVGYHAGDLILLPNNSYTSGILMSRISEHLKTAPIFVGGDGWGDWSVGFTGKIRSRYDYSGYRVAPWSLAKTDAATEQFKKSFRKAFGKDATASVSIASYTALTSVVDVVGGLSVSGDVRSAVFAAYEEAVRKDHDLARPSTFAVFKVSQDGESLEKIYP
jgi:ABC-type branched-subunit amino acid transport system substrate-binding protein